MASGAQEKLQQIREKHALNEGLQKWRLRLARAGTHRRLILADCIIHQTEHPEHGIWAASMCVCARVYTCVQGDIFLDAFNLGNSTSRVS